MKESKGMKVLKIYSIVVLSIAIVIGVTCLVTVVLDLILHNSFLRMLWNFPFEFYFSLSLTLTIPLLISVVLNKHYRLKNVVFTIFVVLMIFGIIMYILDNTMGNRWLYGYSYEIFDMIFEIIAMITEMPILVSFVILPPLVYLYLCVRNFKKTQNAGKIKLTKEEKKLRQQQIDSEDFAKEDDDD